MAARLKKLLRLFALYARMDAQWFAQDTALCLVCVLSETLSSIASVTAVFLLAVRFGGVGGSGMGQYHGRRSFDCFSHEKSIVHKATWLDLPFRYAPYAKWKDRLIRMFLR